MPVNHKGQSLILEKKTQRKRKDELPKLDLFRGSSASTITGSPANFTRLTRPKRTEVFATYWKFAKARQDVFFAQFSRANVPTQDPIIRRHRFTNVYRSADRVSQYLIRHVLYNQRWSPIDLVFRLLIFKFFNKIATWEALDDAVGPITWKDYDFRSYDRCLDKLMVAGETVYSAAYIMPSGKSEFGYARKHQNHLKVIEAMMAAELPNRLVTHDSLESVFNLLCSFPTIGPFIGYQLAIDLNYSTLLDFSENDFVKAGPGALDGISKCFSDLGDFTPADVIRYMVDEQERAIEAYAPGFKNLWGRPLHLIDCQNLFCEVSKYARVMHPDIQGSSGRSRIKQLYRPAKRPLEDPWFPPKWAINERIELEN